VQWLKFGCCYNGQKMLLLPRAGIFLGGKAPWWLLGAEKQFFSNGNFFKKNFSVTAAARMRVKTAVTAANKALSLQ
jgi:hypothetical protein